MTIKTNTSHKIALAAALTLSLSTPLLATPAGDAQNQAQRVVLAQSGTPAPHASAHGAIAREPQQQAAAPLVATASFPRALVCRQDQGE